MKQVADELKITVRTVAAGHKYAVMGLLQLKTNAELVQYAVEHRIIGQTTFEPGAVDFADETDSFPGSIGRSSFVFPSRPRRGRGRSAGFGIVSHENQLN